MTLTSRERVECALHHQEPDRVPWDAQFNIYTYAAVCRHLCLPVPKNPRSNVNSTVGNSLDLTEALDLDVVHVGLGPSSREAPFDFNADTYVDEWGVGFRHVQHTEGQYAWELAHHPLADAKLEDLDKYPWPDPNDPARIAGLGEHVRRLYEDTPYAILGRFNVPPFFHGFYLCGLERWLTALLQDREFADAVLAKVTNIAMELDRAAMEEVGRYISIFRCAGDDIGTEGGPLVSPRTFRTVVKPHLQRLYQNGLSLIEKYAPRARLCIHTDGDIYLLIPDLIDAGVQVLNCVQPVGRMDHRTLKREFGDRLAFHGGLDIREEMVRGGPADVERLVRDCIARLGPGGGYVLAPTNYVLPDVPPENILAARDAVRKWGQYPLTWAVEAPEAALLTPVRPV